MQHFDPLSRAAINIHRMGNTHASIRPLNPFLERDLVLQTRDSVLVADTSRTRFRIQPVADIGGGLSAHPTAGFAGVGSAGFQAELFIKNRWFFRAGYQTGFQHFPNHLELLNNRVGTLQGLGRSEGLEAGGHIAHYITGTAGIRMGDHFSLEVGREKHFWGDGYRSPVLSHNATPYPYARLTTKVWKLKYVNLWAMMDDFDHQTFERRNKFVAIHALSWNLTKRFNLSVYEAVVWQAEDQLVNRGFDYAYLNPFIFYRPIEFAKGSADNMLLGLSMRYDVSRSVQIYGQLYFDEFKISELRAQRQWWGNKFAIQLGVKAYDVLAEGHSFLSEFNMARPYMYTHGSRLQAYTHSNLALAHPLGANFAEWVTRNRFTVGKYEVASTFLIASHAKDRPGRNLGNDVLTPYRGLARAYGNYMFQGERHDLIYFDTEVARPLGVGELMAFGTIGIRKVANETDSPFDTWFMLGIRTPIVRPYRDF